jgi:hypothetical protein
MHHILERKREPTKTSTSTVCLLSGKGRNDFDLEGRDRAKTDIVAELLYLRGESRPNMVDFPSDFEQRVKR